MPAYIALISLGLLGVAWPSIRANFGLPLVLLLSVCVLGTARRK